MAETEKSRPERERILVVRRERLENEPEIHAAKAQCSAMFVRGEERQRSWWLVGNHRNVGSANDKSVSPAACGTCYAATHHYVTLHHRIVRI
ncbi:MAG TPA: hypothetical protein VL096_12895 [Pirellulaceae bacterium]|nr:hypothetical protein [Pirellulaceae bacterium]